MEQGGRRRRWGAVAAGAVLASALFVSSGVGPVAAIGLPLPATLLSITVSPTGATVAAGETQQFTATGAYSDLSSRVLTASVTWATSDSSVATISNSGATKGRATGVATGGVSVTATDPTSGVSGTALLAVTPIDNPVPVTLVTIAVTPPATTIAVGATTQLSATGTYSDLTSKDLTQTVTWASSDPSIAPISNANGSKGRATGVAGGSATITATDTASGISGTAVLAVTPPIVIPPILPPRPQARLFTLTPSLGTPGTTVHIVGVKFPAWRKVKVSYVTGAHPRQVKLCKATAQGDGRFSCVGTIPGMARAGAAGSHVIVAKILKPKGQAPVFTRFRTTS